MAETPVPPLATASGVVSNNDPAESAPKLAFVAKKLVLVALVNAAFAAARFVADKLVLVALVAVRFVMVGKHPGKAALSERRR